MSLQDLVLVLLGMPTNRNVLEVRSCWRDLGPKGSVGCFSLLFQMADHWR